jgi:hypothetical protein
MPRYTTPPAKDENGGYTDWIFPRRGNVYKLACCDCGLVHDLEFAVVNAEDIGGGRIRIWKARGKNLQVAFRAKRNERSTAQMRRHKNQKG